jgi:hypothetical protein
LSCLTSLDRLFLARSTPSRATDDCGGNIRKRAYPRT